jgi:drug/metabolite transporter (DMT)-like permease
MIPKRLDTMSENKMVYFLMILAAFIWGGTFNAAGFALNGFHPLSVAFIRFALATVVLLIAGHREIFGTPVTGRDWPNFILLGLTGIFAYNVFFMYAMKYTSPVNGSLITAINPVVTTLLATFLLKERFTARLAGGVLISFLGVGLVISGGSWQVIRSLEFNYGDILALLSVFSWSFYSITIKRTSSRFSPMVTTFYGFLTGTVLLLPFGLICKPGPAAFFSAGAPAVTAILYLSLIGSVLAFFWWNRGVSILGAARSAVFVNLIPVATIIISLLFRETITLFQVAGSALVIGAVALVGVREPAPQPEANSVVARG